MCEYVEMCVEAEAHGFYSTLLIEHHFGGAGQVSASLDLLAWVAARTTTLRIGTAVIVLPWHDPVLLSERAATLDLMSGGRFDFGVGKGCRHSEFSGFQMRYDKAEERFNEALEVILKALTSDVRFSHSGRFWQCENVIVDPTPCVAHGRTFDPMDIAVARNLYVAGDDGDAHTARARLAAAHAAGSPSPKTLTSAIGRTSRPTPIRQGRPRRARFTVRPTRSQLNSKHCAVPGFSTSFFTVATPSDKASGASRLRSCPRSPLRIDGQTRPAPCAELRDAGTAMMLPDVSSILDSTEVQGVLERLRVLGQQRNPEYGARVRAREAELGTKLYGLERAQIGAEAPQAVAPEVGRILYALTIATRPRLAVEFGASFGVSTIYLAAALHDLGAGELITTELVELKAQAAVKNLVEAGLGSSVEMRQGDALTSLSDIERPIDMLFLDGSNDLYVDVLTMLGPRLAPHAVVAADLSQGDPHHVHYRDFVTGLDSGFVSVEIPVDAGLVVSTRR